MDKLIDKFKVNLNQNIWILIISLLGLGFSEYFNLQKLMTISFLLTIISFISVFFTLIFYTTNYCKNKF